MLKLVLSFAFLFCARVGATPPKFAMGMSMESRLANEVNPAFSNLKTAGVLFQQFRWGHYGVLGEVSTEEKDSSSGGLGIRTATTGIAAWGRYHFFQPDHWSPFATAGLGMYFDRVSSTFQDQVDVRHGRRLMGGAGAGISNLFLNYVLIEAEVRGALIQDQPSPSAFFILRAGIQI